MSTDALPPGDPQDTATAGGRSRRHQYRINEDFQNRFRVRLLGFALVILVPVAALSLVVSYLVAHPGSIPISFWVPVSVAAISLASGFCVFRLSDRLSHRYCGPFVPIMRALEQIRRGEETVPIRLRKNDEYGPLVEALNAIFQQLDVMEVPDKPPETDGNL